MVLDTQLTLNCRWLYTIQVLPIYCCFRCCCGYFFTSSLTSFAKFASQPSNQTLSKQLIYKHTNIQSTLPTTHCTICYSSVLNFIGWFLLTLRSLTHLLILFYEVAKKRDACRLNSCFTIYVCHTFIRSFTLLRARFVFALLCLMEFVFIRVVCVYLFFIQFPKDEKNNQQNK